MANAKLNVAFWKWFGDSKVVDENGLPLVMYHGTGRKKFSEFIDYRPNFFTPNREYAEGYVGGKKTKTGQLMKVLLSIKNPFDTRQEEYRRIYNDDFLPYAIEKSYDKDRFKLKLNHGELIPFTTADLFFVFLRKASRENILSNDGYLVDEHFGVEPAWVPLYPRQIKSATGNDGTWDADDPSITSNPPSTKSLKIGIKRAIAAGDHKAAAILKDDLKGIT